MATSLTGGGQGPITGLPILSGKGSPEGVYYAPVGSLYRRTDGTWDETLYIKEDSSNGVYDKEGWTAYGSATPPGTILDYAGITEPDGWLLCFGQTVATADFPKLFAAIGYTYGGSGANFKIPDLRGFVVAGVPDMGGTFDNMVLTVSKTGNTTNGSAAITAVSPFTQGLFKGMYVTGLNIPQSVINSVDSGSQVTLSANCTGTATGTSIRFHCYNPLNNTGGEMSHFLDANEMPSHQHLFNYPYNAVAGIAGGANYNQNPTPTQGTSFTGGSQYHNNVQPIKLMRKIIKT